MDAMVCPTEVRKTVLSMLYKGKAAHLGSSMSVIEMLVAMYSSVNAEKIKAGAADRSRIIISKGHCAAAVYGVMAHFGLVKFSDLDGYYQNDSYLAGHVSHGVKFVEHSTGALGHGLSVACGCAIGLRARGYVDSNVFALVGDGEIQEGSIWEALMFARHHRLSNLITLVDDNKISSITTTSKVIDMNPMRERFLGFGFKVFDVNGHDVNEIKCVIQNIVKNNELAVIVCHTVKGFGVPFAENEPVWHYRSLSENDYKLALEALDKCKTSNPSKVCL